MDVTVPERSKAWVRSHHDGALHWGETLVAVGLLALVAGAVVTLGWPRIPWVAVAVFLVFLGPVVAFLATMGTFTYLEEIEPETYRRTEH